MDGVHEIAAGGRRFSGVGVRELWGYRDLALTFAQRDIQLRYRQTALGIGWALIRPLAAAVVFTLLFGEAVGVASEGLPYATFVLSGLALWGFVAAGTEAAGAALVDDPDMVTRVWFPRLLAPIGAVLPGLLDLLVALGAMVVLMVVQGVGPGIAVLTAPLWVLAAALLAFGAGSLLCALSVRFRDVKETFPYMVQLWFFATPVVFAASIVEGTGRWVLAANPACGLIDGWRWAVVGAPAPPAEDLLSLLAGIVLVGVGLIYFKLAESRFADVI
jgi:lipopolysaccharide transport system permease protein